MTDELDMEYINFEMWELYNQCTVELKQLLHVYPCDKCIVRHSWSERNKEMKVCDNFLNCKSWLKSFFAGNYEQLMSKYVDRFGDFIDYFYSPNRDMDFDDKFLED